MYYYIPDYYYIIVQFGLLGLWEYFSRAIYGYISEGRLDNSMNLEALRPRRHVRPVGLYALALLELFTR